MIRINFTIDQSHGEHVRNFEDNEMHAMHAVNGVQSILKITGLNRLPFAHTLPATGGPVMWPFDLCHTLSWDQPSS